MTTHPEPPASSLPHYLSRWHLSDPHLMARTATSTVYRVRSPGGPAALKLLTKIGAWDERHAPAALRHYDGRGAVRLLAADAGAHLLEYLPGGDLVAQAVVGDTETTRIIGQVIHQLHLRPPGHSAAGIRPLRAWFRELFERAAVEAGETLFVRGARLADALLNSPQQVRVLHGDIHHGNIRRGTVRGWLAIDPKGIVGERTYDTANTFYNPTPAISADAARIRRTADLLAQITGIGQRRILAYAFAYGCLSAAWSISSAGGDENDPAATNTLRVARLVEQQLHRA